MLFGDLVKYRAPFEGTLKGVDTGKFRIEGCTWMLRGLTKWDNFDGSRGLAHRVRMGIYVDL